MEDNNQISGVSKEVADEEIEKWLAFKKISQAQREEHSEFIKALVEYVSEGTLQMNEDFSFIHTLKFPVGVSGDITELKYKARMNPKQLKPYLSNLKAGDNNGLVWAHICALSSQSSGIINELDQEDIKVARALVVFFI